MEVDAWEKACAATDKERLVQRTWALELMRDWYKDGTAPLYAETIIGERFGQPITVKELIEYVLSK
jgi:hypothetical protein